MEKIFEFAGASLKGVPFRPLTQRFFRKRLSIVFYHGVWQPASAAKQHFWGLNLDEFRADIQELSQRFRFVSLDEMLTLNAHRADEDGKPPLAVTFDDGHEMIRTGALDMLEEFGIRSTMFVVNSCVGNTHLMWTHALNAVRQLKGEATLLAAMEEATARRGLHLGTKPSEGFPYSPIVWPMDGKDEIVAEIFAAADMPPVAEYLDEHRPYFTWDGLATWIARGQFVGLHTDTHPYCSRLRADGIRREIVAPAHALRTRLGIEKLPFAYPFGDRIANHETEMETFREAGFTTMLGVTGISQIGASAWSIERVDAERGLGAFLYARPMARALAGRG